MDEPTSLKLQQLIWSTIDAEIFSATRQPGSEQIICKMVSNIAADPAKSLAHLQQEYLVTAQLLNHYHLPVLGEDKIDGKPVFLYESQPHRPLAIINREQQFSIADNLHLAIELSSALNTIHAQGIVHRNVCAHSVLWDPNTQHVRLTDFGLARSLASSAPHSNDDIESDNDNSVDPAYMSPEMTGRINRSSDFRSDFYSLGVLLYEQFAGSLPFSANDMLSLVHSHLAITPPSPKERNPELPGVLSDIIMKLLEKMPENRYQSGQGLLSDLNRCLKEYRNTQSIASFPIGSADVHEQFLIADKIYGREPHIQALLKAWNETCEGRRQVTFIHGVAGIGKTRLTKELQHKVAIQGGLFFSGKFEQYSASTPYLGFVRVFESLAQHILMQNDDDIEQWKKLIQEALTPNGKILTDLVPQMAQIIGPQAAIPNLGVSESHNRFKQLFLPLLNAIATIEHPIVIMQDDLHWADPASLKLFQELATNSNQHLMLLGCYRDDHVNAQHLLTTTRDAIGNGQTPYTDIKLENLKHENIQQLILDTLHVSQHCDNAYTQELSANIFNSTQGNPFFAKQLLQQIYDDGLINWDNASNCWQLKDPELNKIHYAADIKELLHQKFIELPKATRQLLKTAACLGNRFTLSDLRAIHEHSDINTEYALEAALTAGLIASTNHHYQFIHDRVQQSANASNHELPKINLQIARRLSASLSKEEQGERQFELAGYWNAAYDEISAADEIQLSIEINQTAARKANAANAYHSALVFAQRATDFTNEKTHEQNPEQAFDVYFELARTQYLNGNISQSQKLSEELIHRSNNLADDSRCYALLKDIITNQGNDYAHAVQLGCAVLNKAGIAIPESTVDTIQSIEQLEKKINDQLLDSSTKDITTQLSSLPNTDHGDHKHKLRLLMDLWEAAYYAGNAELMNLCAMHMVEQSLKHGNASESAFAYVLFAIRLSLTGQYSRAHEFGAFALQLNSVFNDRILLPKITNIFCNYTAYFKQPFNEITKLYQRSARYGKENGDYLFGVWAIFFMIWTDFLAGSPLPQVYQATLKHQGFIEQSNDIKMQRAFRMLQLGLLHLMNKKIENDFLRSADEELTQSLEYWEAEQFIPGHTWYAIFAGQINYLTGGSEQALDDYTHYGLEKSPVIIMFPLSQYDFYQCMAELDNIERVEPHEQQRRITHAKATIEQLAPLAKNCAENFAHQYWLLQAETARVENNIEQAAQHFGKALEAIQKSSNLYVAALTNELTARFWLTQNNTGFASQFINRAYHLYQQWGALHKTAQLALDYTALLTIKPLEEPTQKPSSDEQDVAHLTHRKTSSSVSISDLDLAAILQSAQAMTKETNISRLLESIVWICAEQTGAQRGVLVTANKTLRVECVVESTPRRKASTVSTPLSESHDACHSIIRYAARTGTNMVLNNASHEGEYVDDPYIKQRQIKSVLCVPFFHRDQVAGLIYLENNLASSVFTEQRIETLHILLGQAAILLQNARVHFALQQSEERTRLSHGYAKIGTWEWDVNTDDLHWSETISPMFGYTDSVLETSVENFNKVVHPDDLEMLSAAITDCVENDTPYNIDHRIIWPDGSQHWMNEVGGVIRDKSGQPLRMIGIVRDITDAVIARDKQAQTQNQLQQAQKMEAVGQLTGGIAHDFNNMLASILGYSELLQAENNQHPNEKIGLFLDEIITAGYRASKVVKQLLAFSRNETGKSSLVNLRLLTEETLKLLRASIPTSIELLQQIDEDVEPILADLVQVQQVLMNLCLNARDATGETGRITLNLSQTSHINNEVCASCLEPISGDYVALSITNSGDAIDPEVIRRMFDPFFTTKDVGKGSGMGLAMSHGILHSCGGHITVHSEPHSDTRFTLLFPPYVDPSKQSVLDAPASQSHSNQPLQARVMVVDDERTIVNLLTATLQSAGCTVDAFFNSEEALRHFEQFPDDFDLVVTDQTMPKLTGIELAKRMLAQRPELPIILSTGYSATVDEETALTAGIKAYLAKPYSPDSLISIVARLLNSAS